MELKSNEDGKALIDVLEIGETVRLQIIVKGLPDLWGRLPDRHRPRWRSRCA